MNRIRLAGSEIQFDCSEGDTILRAALRSGVGMSYSCNVGSCGNCRFELIEGEVHHMRADSPAWTEKDRARNRWLGCQAVPHGDCQVKFRQDPSAILPIRPSQRVGTLISRTDLNHDIAEFAFSFEGDSNFIPGQYALIGVEGVEGQRVYSMCNLPGEGIWRFQIKRVPNGAATGVLFESLKPGDKVSLDGPYGLAYLREDSARDLILLAGGSGLSPMVSIARGALASQALAQQKVHFFFGGRGPADMKATDFLKDLVSDRFTLTCAVSDPALATDWTGARGFIHEVADELHGEALANCEIYFAGPPAMAQAIQLALRNRGVPPTQVHFDEFY